MWLWQRSSIANGPEAFTESNLPIVLLANKRPDSFHILADPHSIGFGNLAFRRATEGRVQSKADL